MEMEDYKEILTDYGFNYLAITKDSLKDGTGIRTVLWTAGCDHACPGCQNPFSHDPCQGELFDLEAETDLFEALSRDHVEGLTLSGGDPLYAGTRNGIGRLVKNVKQVFPEKSIWLYTGFTFQVAREDGMTVSWFEREVMKSDEYPISVSWIEDVDVICDGRFHPEIRKKDLEENKDPHWVGSSNQRVIDVKKSLAAGKVVLLEEPSKATRMPKTDRNYLMKLATKGA